MPARTVRNWFGDITSHPATVVNAGSVKTIQNVLGDPQRYPSPVRAVGSNHSTSACGVAEGGTLLKMSKMNRILSITDDEVTVQAGAIYIDVAKELEKRGLQFYVNTEIGNLSAGSAACSGTKDSSMPGEFGQVGSYITRITMVLPNGDLLEVTDDQPELMQKVRSSYGTFGIVYEVSFRVRKIQPMAVRHETFHLAEFLSRLPEFQASGESLMFYIFPFEDLVTIEFRRYNPGASGDPDRHIWPLRNTMWARSGPLFCAETEATISIPAVRYKIIDGFCGLWRFKLENFIRSDNTVATDQIIRYPDVGDASKYTFSFWAFPEEQYPAVLSEYFDFARKYYQEKKYRTNMLHVGYRILQDRNSLLSYSWDGNVITIDPVSTANPGWNEFLDAYNGFCSDHGGLPLGNQTPGITRNQVRKAFGARWDEFAEARRQFDPDGRLLNDYFRQLLAESLPAHGN